MFYQALLLAIEEKKVADPELHEPFEIDNAVEASIKIEKCLFEQHGNPSNDAYKKAFRSKYLNLKDKANPGLRGQILSGDISPSDFIKMSPSEMASEERRKEDDRINKENLLKARAAKDNESETDMFQCSRCKQRKCKYFQLQTRSADEPMTTYVTCIHCGHRWRM
ncbi:transcription elongation factor [Mitosporidium daphniae]|uniref:Transcription elongation factor n=1 Tax=Mitosporidium daphniae TaxID=1485682 RepID=A0A098VSK5_9MICR|nr:transcription elongation factor [Mitosporidium daphniae]KGG51962.1 transcription elongation factor [Mitosporidium daphniae]|eukprot:XP_013238398.1 transcription elongation factor [Mitosporidium daphniae]